MELAPPQWEYCQLILIGARVPPSYPGQHVMTASEPAPEDARRFRPQSPRPPMPIEVHYDVAVVYAGPDGSVTTRQLVSLEQVQLKHPYHQAIGLLGGAGWELVAIEPPRDNSWLVEDRELPYDVGLRATSRIAHFKRPVLHGRRVDEPPIELAQT